jgi:putative SOS response-associated peptidase YedK
MPTPPERVKGKADSGTTNIRNTQYAHWQPYLGVESRCVVPANIFAEPSPKPGDKDPETGIQRNYWFALDDSLPLFFWTRWQGTCWVKDGPGDHQVYGFLTTRPNGVVAPIHDKTMPVVLTTREEVETWLTAPWSETKDLQRPLPDDQLVIVPKPATQLLLKAAKQTPRAAPAQGSLF